MFDGNGQGAPGPESSLDASDVEFGASRGGGGASPNPDDLFGALATGERRHLLYALLEEPTWTVEEAADLLAGCESGTRGPVGPAGRRRIASRLHHVHLPLLADAGLVTYDPETGTIRLRDVAGHVRDLVRFAREYDRAAGGPSP